MQEKSDARVESSIIVNVIVHEIIFGLVGPKLLHLMKLVSSCLPAFSYVALETASAGHLQGKIRTCVASMEAVSISVESHGKNYVLFGHSNEEIVSCMRAVTQSDSEIRHTYFDAFILKTANGEQIKVSVITR